MAASRCPARVKRPSPTSFLLITAADYAGALGMDFFNLRDHFVDVAGDIDVFLVWRVRGGAQWRQTLDRGTVRQNYLLAFGFREAILKPLGVVRLSRIPHAVEKQDVDLFRAGLLAEHVDFDVGIGGGVDAAFRHHFVVIARETFQGDGQHFWHSAIVFGGFEEVNAAAVCVTDQTGETVPT